MKNVINGNVFIIPNECVKVSEFLPTSKEVMIKNLERFGFHVGDDTILVQVWATGPEVDNWSCHGWLPEFLDNSELNSFGNEILVKRFPTYLPVNIFLNKKEGDTVIIKTESEEHLKDGLMVNLKLNQLEYRYGNWGPFEKVLQQKLSEIQFRVK